MTQINKDREKFYDELIAYIENLRKKQDVINSVHLRTTIRILKEIKPHFLKRD